MIYKQIIAAGLGAVMLASCVSTKKFQTMQVTSQTKYDSLYAIYNSLQSSLRSCQDSGANLSAQKTALENKIDELNRQMALLKENNNSAMKQLQDLSVITASQAQSISKSLDNIGAKDAYIMDLQAAMARKDSLNMALVMNLKGAIGNLDDQDINIKVDKCVVFIVISDKLLF